MRGFLKVLSILIVSGVTVFNTVACNKNTINNGGSKSPDNKLVIYNVSFEEITSVDGLNFKFNNLGYYRAFQFLQKNVFGSSDLPSDFWRDVDGEGTLGVDFSVYDDNIWDKVASIYGFTRVSTRDEIVNLMRRNSIINVDVKISRITDKWKLLDFSALIKN